jgi:ribose/xylose/arabinose/galactoside ABC-type transport system permease subunit
VLVGRLTAGLPKLTSTAALRYDALQVLRNILNLLGFDLFFPMVMTGVVTFSAAQLNGFEDRHRGRA